MDRIQSIGQQLATADSLEVFGYNSLYTEDEEDIRKRFRILAEKEIQPHLSQYIENAQFPSFLRQKFKEFGMFKLFVGRPYGEGKSTRLIGILISEMARIDSGLSLFMLVQWSVLITTIEWFGSEIQKKEYLPALIDCDKIGGWALTEPNFGSDASGLESNVVKTEGGYILNGAKRWIGNGNGEIVVVWVKNNVSSQIEGFIVEMNSKGVSRKVIEHKLAVRMVQNYHLIFENVFIPDDKKLPFAKSFQESTNLILRHSRIVAIWISSGICRGVCDYVLKALPPRDKPKVLSMISSTQSILLMAWRVSELYDSKQLSIGQVALAKSYATSRAREICVQGKDLLSGIGIQQDNYIMKCLMDIEATHTYEGTYDINVLVGGRELTGIPAFKARQTHSKANQ